MIHFPIKRLLSALICIAAPKLVAQNLKEYNDLATQYSVASPDVYNFEKVTLNPMNYYVGKAKVSVPIYTIKSGGIEFPLNLIYNTGGIKVDQLASDVGLGWSLSTAVITRTVNGANDFDNTGSLTYVEPTYDTRYSAVERDKDYQAFKDNGYSGKIGYFLQKRRNLGFMRDFRQVDFLPDTYHFYSGDFSTNFFFDNVSTPVELSPKGTKIVATTNVITIDSKRGLYNYFTSAWEPNYNLATQDFFNIVLTTPQGIEYTFSDCDYALTEKILGTDAVDFSDSPAQISAWHITRIKDLNTSLKVEFTYENNTAMNPNHPFAGSTAVYMPSAQRFYEYTKRGEYSAANPCMYYSPSTGSEIYTIDKYVRVDVLKKRLKTISFDQGTIEFSYNAQGTRSDIYNGDYVSQIVVKNKHSQVIKTFNLQYDYFTSSYGVGEFNPDNANNSYRYKRLKLISIAEVGKPKHKFSYNETTNLPPVNSFAIDFMGYANGSADVPNETILNNNRYNPVLYFYANQLEKSLLPFPVTGVAPTITIPGYFNRRPHITSDEYVKAWSLKKIEYPTGGSSTLNYESNTFEFLGQSYKGGGTRIASQSIAEGSGFTKTVNYSYLKESGLSSGSLGALPYFGYPVKKFYSVSFDYYLDYDQPQPPLVSDPVTNVNALEWKLTDKSKLNEDITSGAFIGYSRVIESETGLGRTEYKFTANSIPGFQDVMYRAKPYFAPDLYTINPNESCMTDFISANSAFATNIYTDNSYKRGKLLEEKIFNESNDLLKARTINYTDVDLGRYRIYQGFIEPVRNNTDQNSRPFMTVRKDYQIRQYLPASETLISKDAAGNLKQEIANFTYNANGLLKSAETIASNNDTKKTQYYYPTDATTLTSLPGAALESYRHTSYRDLIRFQNNMAAPIQIETYTNGNLNTRTRQFYRDFNSNVGAILPEELVTSKGNGSFYHVSRVNSYDWVSQNPEVITTGGINGKTVAYVRGYNHTLIIAKIEDPQGLYSLDIEDVRTKSDADNDNCNLPSCKEQILKIALNSLRTTLKTTNPDAMITTYTYDPLVGVTSMTDTKGDEIRYFYDANQRLIKATDKDGNILSENAYNYKPQN